mmetsp:Transcript_12909/g.24242  ORF Transcript_12909/g.24242 Transcript_12909/m.24242 type:complete len:365 (+) Transcript_12909:273-1367(+)
MRTMKLLILVFLGPLAVSAFLVTTSNNRRKRVLPSTTRLQEKSLSVTLDPTLTDDRIKSLFAWVSRALDGEDEYNNIMAGFAAVFGTNLPRDSDLAKMAWRAENMLQGEEVLIGAPIHRFEREQASLGAMGAGQWTGQWKTRPHALLDVSNMTSIDDWIQSLPRGCKRTLKKANSQSFTVSSKPILSKKPAPHSSLAHFRCVVEHEVRLIADVEGDIEGFFSALAEAVSRYIGTTRMTGVIQEYRNADGKIIAFAHEVRKARTIRGQWFYADDEASKSYVWFHSVQELVKRAIESDGIDTVDLGPSGSDAFSELKAKYGFESIDDWPSFADYTSGPFYHEGQDEDLSDDEDRERMLKLLRMLGM